MTDEESRALKVPIDGPTIQAFGNSTWMTDAGGLDILFEIPDREGNRQRYEDLAPRSVTAVSAGLTVRLAALEDIIASKEHADRPKDHEALPELHQLHERQGGPVRGRWTEPPYQRPSRRSGRHDDPGRDLDR